MIIIHGFLKVNPDHRAAFLEHAGRAVELSKAEEGNLYYRMFEAVDEPNTFLTLEKWANQHAIENHKTSAHFTEFIRSAKELFTAPLDLDVHIVPENE